MSNEHRRGILLALGSALGIACFVIPWKMAVTHGDATINALLLLVWAGLFNSLLTLYQQRSIPRFGRLELGVAAALAVFTLLGNLASAIAITLVGPALMTVLQRSEVIIIAALAWPILGERIDARFIIGTVIAGCGLVLLQDPFDTYDARALGIAWSIASAISFSAMTIVTRKFIHRIDLVAVNALRLWLAVALWFVVFGFPAELFQINSRQLGFMAVAAFFGPFLGRLCLMASARYLEARLSALAILAAPPLTLVLVYLVLSELPSTRELQGGAIMLIGITIPIIAWARPRAARGPRGAIEGEGSSGS